MIVNWLITRMATAKPIDTIILLMGPPLIGKTTQAKLLSTKNGWMFLSAKDLEHFFTTAVTLAKQESSTCLVIDDVQENPDCLNFLIAQKCKKIELLYLVGLTDSDLECRCKKISSKTGRKLDFTELFSKYEQNCPKMIFDVTRSEILPIDARGNPETVSNRILNALLSA